MRYFREIRGANGEVPMTDSARKVVGILLWSRDEKLLLGRRAPEKKLYPGLWQAPGGGVEEGESGEGAIRRELAEETGILLQEPLEELDFQGEVLPNTKMFQAKLELHAHDVSLQVSEFSELRWFIPEELPGLALVPDGERLLRMLFPELWRGAR